MTPVQLAWAGLMGAARQFAAAENASTQGELSITAIQYAKLRVANDKPKKTGVDTEGAPVVGFGKNKGQLLSATSVKDLQWLQGALQRSVDDPEKARFLDKNQTDLEAVEAELESR